MGGKLVETKLDYWKDWEVLLILFQFWGQNLSPIKAVFYDIGWKNWAWAKIMYMVSSLRVTDQWLDFLTFLMLKVEFKHLWLESTSFWYCHQKIAFSPLCLHCTSPQKQWAQVDVAPHLYAILQSPPHKTLLQGPQWEGRHTKTKKCKISRKSQKHHCTVSSMFQAQLHTDFKIMKHTLSVMTLID